MRILSIAGALTFDTVDSILLNVTLNEDKEFDTPVLFSLIFSDTSFSWLIVSYGVLIKVLNSSVISIVWTPVCSLNPTTKKGYIIAVPCGLIKPLYKLLMFGILLSS